MKRTHSLDGSATFGQLAVARRDPLHVLCYGQDVVSALRIIHKMRFSGPEYRVKEREGPDVVWLFCAAERDHDLTACDLAGVNGLRGVS